MVAEAVLWACVGTILYIYVGYPAVIALLGNLRSRTVQRGPIRPRLTLLIGAHNEARGIARKLENCLELEYPKDCLEIVVASDGSTDRTVEIAEQFERQGIKVISFETRRGKPALLNDTISRCGGQIVALSDVRQIYDRQALIALVENFADPSVGAVSGELDLIHDGTVGGVGGGIGFYWRYEKFIRRHESRFDSTVGATGAIYAIRRDLFEPIPADTLLDDVLIPMRIVRRGYRVVFEPQARAFDRVAKSSSEEFTRKVRTIAGNLQLFTRERWLWSVRGNRLWFQAISHKLLRVPGPFLLAAAFAANLVLVASSSAYLAALVAQLLFYGAALAGLFFGNATPIGRLLSVPYAFCTLNLSAFVGTLRFFAGTQTVTWQKAADLASPGSPMRYGKRTSEE